MQTHLYRLMVKLYGDKYSMEMMANNYVEMREMVIRKL